LTIDLSSIEEVLRRAIEQARSVEICGFVLRHPVQGISFMRVPNLSEHPGAFSVSGLDADRCRRYATREGSEIVAFLHSHNTGVHPSHDDMIFRKLSDIPWVIVCLSKGKLEVHWF
jgi:proteasome lid subunit RPN8/RPN11